MLLGDDVWLLIKIILYVVQQKTLGWTSAVTCCNIYREYFVLVTKQEVVHFLHYQFLHFRDAILFFPALSSGANSRLGTVSRGIDISRDFPGRDKKGFYGTGRYRTGLNITLG